jgi:branched-chain amino acid transport system permease protein
MLGDYTATLTLIALTAIFAYSFYAVLMAGQLSLGQAGIASLAGFGATLIMPDSPFFGLNPLVVGVPVGMLVGAVVAFLLGLPVMRLRGVFLAIATLGFAEMVRIVLINAEWTGGAQGTSVPKLVTPGFAWGCLALVAYWFWRLSGSRFGRGLAAIREDELARGPWASTSAATGWLPSSPPAPSPACTACCSPTSRASSPLTTSASRRRRRARHRRGGRLAAVRGPVARQRLPHVGAGDPARARRRGGLDPPVPRSPAAARRHPVPARRPVQPHPALADPRLDPSVRAPDLPPLPTPGTPVVTLQGLGKAYGGVHAVRSIDLELRSGEILGLIGPNGAGKTTLVNLISGLSVPTSGTGTVLGIPLGPDGQGHRFAQAGVSRTFQHSKLFDRLTVLENALVGGHVVTKPTLLRRLLWLPSARRDEQRALAQAGAQLAAVGLADRAGVDAGALSYGDRRRLEIARALAAHPTLLILDEPAAGMNHVEAGELSTLIRTLADDGITVLLIEHNVRMVLETCTRIVVLNFGEVIAEGDPATVAKDAVVIEAYLGSDGPADTRV